MSDAGLYLPLGLVAGVPGFAVAVVVVLGIVSEMAGVVAIQIGAERRYDGPLGKSDRAFVFGCIFYLLGCRVAPGTWLDVVLWAMAALSVATIVNRSRRALEIAAGHSPDVESTESCGQTAGCTPSLEEVRKLSVRLRVRSPTASPRNGTSANMARYFLDSSALVKCYHQESGSSDLERLFLGPDNRFFIFRLALVEVHSSFARLVREGVFTESDFGKLISRLEADVTSGVLAVAAVSSRRLEAASFILRTHGLANNVRTLDAIQLATARALHGRSPLAAFVAADKKLLKSAAVACGFTVIDVG